MVGVEVVVVVEVGVGVEVGVVVVVVVEVVVGEIRRRAEHGGKTVQHLTRQRDER